MALSNGLSSLLNNSTFHSLIRLTPRFKFFLLEIEGCAFIFLEFLLVSFTHLHLVMVAGDGRAVDHPNQITLCLTHAVRETASFFLYVVASCPASQKVIGITTGC